MRPIVETGGVGLGNDRAVVGTDQGEENRQVTSTENVSGTKGPTDVRRGGGGGAGGGSGSNSPMGKQKQRNGCGISGSQVGEFPWDLDG